MEYIKIDTMEDINAIKLKVSNEEQF